jgi:hypothetical protein
VTLPGRSRRSRQRATAGPRPGVTAAGRPAGRPGRASTTLFGGTLLLGAALLFAVQPMFARMVLPVLGGSSAVWATAMVFFQAALLAAYAYAHWSTRRLGSRRQAVLHVALLVPPMLLLPAGLPAGWQPPASGPPAGWLLGLLTVAIGPPFVAVAATAPLLQRWYVDSGHPRGADPYFLYRASNLGSILGLLGYPLLLEPLLPLAAQARLWLAGYLLLALLVAACAAVLWRAGPALQPPAADGLAAGGLAAGGLAAGGLAAGGLAAGGLAAGGLAGGGPAGSGRAGSPPLPAAGGPAADEPAARVAGPDRAGRPAGRPSGWRWLSWLALAFVPSCLLIGVTNVLTTDLAPIPLLWVLPLAVYLATFVLAFSPGGWAARAVLVSHRLLPALAAVGLWVLLSAANQPLEIFIPLHLVVFGVAALCCHGRLAAQRPPADSLTGFYLTLAAGGALGGAAAGLLAPVVFDRLLEYPLGLVLALLALPATGTAAVGSTAGPAPARLGRARSGPARSGLPAAVAVLLPAAAVGGLLLVGRLGLSRDAARRVDLLLLGAAMVAAGLLARRRPLTRAVALGAVFLLATSTLARLEGVIFADRSFYGALAVRHSADGEYHILLHGTTIHGAQATDPARRTTPLTYFTVPGPAGDVLRAARSAGHTGRVAVVGLGAGTLACQAQPGERFTFYELDPLVLRTAADPALFSYLRDCPGRPAVLLGDARVTLARQPAARYGSIVLDAFSSDVVPVHLLTRQAVELYRTHLEPGGLISFNITSRYLDLEPVLGRVAAELGASCVSRVDGNADAAGFGPGKSGSHWLAVASTPADLGALPADPRWLPCRVSSGPVWTDDYANVVGALDW